MLIKLHEYLMNMVGTVIQAIRMVEFEDGFIVEIGFSAWASATLGGIYRKSKKTWLTLC